MRAASRALANLCHSLLSSPPLAHFKLQFASLHLSSESASRRLKLAGRRARPTASNWPGRAAFELPKGCGFRSMSVAWASKEITIISLCNWPSELVTGLPVVGADRDTWRAGGAPTKVGSVGRPAGQRLRLEVDSGPCLRWAEFIACARRPARPLSIICHLHFGPICRN